MKLTNVHGRMVVVFSAVLFLVSAGAGGETVDLELERSGNLQDWENVPVGIDLLTGQGKVRLPAGGDSGFFRLRVTHGESDVVPDGFVRVPAGTYARGDHLNEAESWMARSRPVHGVYVSEFFLAATPVTYGEWEETHAWAVANGYSFANVGQRGSDAAFEGLPFLRRTIFTRLYGNWYDMVKWCNARSEMEGLPVVYYTDDALTSVYRVGQEDISNAQVNWRANGYRLPTLAESERAARGGLEGRRWPWGSEPIDGALANYWDSSDTNGTTQVGTYPPNGYGFYDIAGNVWERCWDWFDASWYGEAGASDLNTRGPNSGIYRVARGGSWNFEPEYGRAAYYGGSDPQPRETPGAFASAAPGRKTCRDGLMPSRSRCTS